MPDSPDYSVRRIDFETTALPSTGTPPRPLSHPKRMTLRQQQFCEYYVHHGNAAKAAREAGYSPHNAAYTGVRLLRDTRVRAQIHQLRQHHARETVWEMEDLFDKLDVIYDKALTDNNYHAAVRAVEVQAKIKAQASVRLNRAAISSLQETAIPEAGTLQKEADHIRRFLRPVPEPDGAIADEAEDMSPETFIMLSEQENLR